MSCSDNPFNSIHEIPKTELIPHLRRVISTLNFLPFIAVMLLILLDIVSLFLPAIFRNPNKLLITVLFQNGAWFECGEIVFWWAVARAIAFPIYYLCNRINLFATGTEKVLKEYLEAIENPLKPNIPNGK